MQTNNSAKTKFKNFLLKYFGTSHIFWTLFKFLFTFYIGIFFGGIIVSYLLSPTPDFKYVTDSFLNMMEEVMNEEKIDIFSKEVATTPLIKRSFFYNAYISKAKLVVITGAMKNWGAMTKWTDSKSNSYLSKLAGNKKRIVRISNEKVFGKTVKYDKMTIRSFLLHYKTSPYYLSRLHLKGDFLIDVPPQLNIGSTLGIPKFRTLSIGSGGQLNPLHFGLYEVFICQISGSRKYTIFNPLDIKYIYPKKKYESEIEDPENVDYSKYPLFKKSTPIQVILKPGEILYIPAHYWFAEKLNSDSDKNMAVRFEYRPHAARYSKIFKTIAKSENGHLKTLKENQ